MARIITKTIDADPVMIRIDVGSDEITVEYRELIREDGKLVSQLTPTPKAITDELSTGQKNQLKGLINALVASFKAKYP